MMQTDVKAVHVESDSIAVAGRCRVKGYHCISGGTAGEVIFRNNNNVGDILLQFNVGTGTQPITMLIPGEGILFPTNVYVELPGTAPNAAKVTVFYG